MERFTVRSDAGWTVPPERLDQALERLARFEDMVQGLEGEQTELSETMARLREEKRERTVQFRELLARKLTNSQLLLTLERWSLR